MDPANSTPGQVDWQADPYWRNRRLSPAQIQVHDVVLAPSRTDTGAILEMKEVLSSSLLPELQNRDRLSNSISFEAATKTRNEQIHLKSLVAEYGWLNGLRGSGVQKSIHDPPELRKCRWIHISSKFPDYLKGCLVGLSDWTQDPAENVAALHSLEHYINQNERFSKHGRFFSPFVEILSTDYGDKRDLDDRPLLLSVPYLDWTVEGQPPPLRFQIGMY